MVIGPFLVLGTCRDGQLLDHLLNTFKWKSQSRGLELKSEKPSGKACACEFMWGFSHVSTLFRVRAWNAADMSVLSKCLVKRRLGLASHLHEVVGDLHRSGHIDMVPTTQRRSCSQRKLNEACRRRSSLNGV